MLPRPAPDTRHHSNAALQQSLAVTKTLRTKLARPLGQPSLKSVGSNLILQASSVEFQHHYRGVFHMLKPLDLEANGASLQGDSQGLSPTVTRKNGMYGLHFLRLAGVLTRERDQNSPASHSPPRLTYRRIRQFA
jgi:hypothetical protein